MLNIFSVKYLREHYKKFLKHEKGHKVFFITYITYDSIFIKSLKIYAQRYWDNHSIISLSEDSEVSWGD